MLIIILALKLLVNKGFGVSYLYGKTYFWDPFDDSRVLHDPNATDKGLRRPLEVA